MSGQLKKRGPTVTLVPAGRSSGVLKDIKDYEVGQFVDCSISSVDTATLKIQLTEI